MSTASRRAGCSAGRAMSGTRSSTTSTTILSSCRVCCRLIARMRSRGAVVNRSETTRRFVSGLRYQSTKEEIPDGASSPTQDRSDDDIERYQGSWASSRWRVTDDRTPTPARSRRAVSARRRRVSDSDIIDITVEEIAQESCQRHTERSNRKQLWPESPELRPPLCSEFRRSGACSLGRAGAAGSDVVELVLLRRLGGLLGRHRSGVGEREERLGDHGGSVDEIVATGSRASVRDRVAV